MYRPRPFAEDRESVLLALIRDYPLGMVCWTAAGRIETTPLPFIALSAEGGGLRLQAHLPRSNPLGALGAAGAQGLITFNGPQAYVSPAWYPTKRLDGRAVPTWNYAVATARGPVSIIDDPAWVRRQIGLLTEQHEAGRAEPWSMEDAPADYMDALVGGLVGLEMTVSDLAGKWKVSQNQPEGNRLGVAAGLREGVHDLAEAMARLVETDGRGSR